MIEEIMSTEEEHADDMKNILETLGADEQKRDETTKDGRQGGKGNR